MFNSEISVGILWKILWQSLPSFINIESSNLQSRWNYELTKGFKNMKVNVACANLEVHNSQLASFVNKFIKMMFDIVWYERYCKVY